MASFSTTSTVSPRDLIDDPFPPLNPAPLLVVFHGRYDEYQQRPQRFHEPVGFACEKVVEELLKIAENLIIHPIAIPIVTRIISGNDHPHDLVEPAVRRVLADFKIAICLSNKWSKKTLGMHAQFHSMKSQKYLRANERVIYLNRFFVERLVKAKADRSNPNPNDFHRHIFIAAIHLARELIHLLRRQVRILLGQYPDVPIPPHCCHVGNFDDDQDFEVQGGWNFEGELIRGLVSAIWFRSHTRNTSHRSRDEDSDGNSEEHNDNSILRSTNRPISPTTFDDSFSTDYDTHLPRVEKHYPFDHIVIKRHNMCYTIKDSWLENFYTSFERGGFSEVQFPPEVNPVPLNPSELDKTVHYNHKRIREDYCIIIRCTDDRTAHY
ncbi:uncharacterized protein IL334_004365 [Kwoniella shivajii]|uniref:Uncharacterized protein n=1 Tax=Kwoniella shivajii TaxID=564305 RepID=A0ABZ1D1H1_9TREE|nr:hypothetical protein IL334_004365 [Kwoniella shivajii]